MNDSNLISYGNNPLRYFARDSNSACVVVIVGIARGVGVGGRGRASYAIIIIIARNIVSTIKYESITCFSVRKKERKKI